jgi:hypothetical protein
MGLIVRCYKNDKYGLFSTITDKMIHRGKLTRNEAIEILKDRAIFDYQRKIEEIEKTFPNGYSDDNRRLIRDKRYMSETEFAEYWYEKNWGKLK